MLKIKVRIVSMFKRKYFEETSEPEDDSTSSNEIKSKIEFLFNLVN